MPRNASGNYTLPLPSVVTGTVIESLWANTTMNDLAASVTDSLDRYGRGGMVAPFRVVDGTVSTPAIAFTGETNTGLYRPSAGVVSVSVLGVEKQTWTSAGTTVGGDLNLLGDFNILGGVEVDGSVLLADDEWLAWGSAVPPFGPYITGSSATDVMKFSTNSTDRMRIDSAGFVGINQASPAAALHVTGYSALVSIMEAPVGGGHIQFRVNGAAKGFFGSSSTLIGGSVNDLTVRAEGQLQFASGGATVKMTLDTAGRLGINNPSPLQRLYVGQGNATELIVVDGSTSGVGGGASVAMYNGGSYKLALGNRSALLGGAYDPNTMVLAANDLAFGASGAERMRLTNVGLGIGMTPVATCDVAGQVRSNFGTNGVSLVASATNPLVQWFYSSVADWRLQVVSTAAMQWDYGGGTVRMCLTSAGQLLIGMNYVTPGLTNINGQSWEGTAGYGVLNHVSGTANGTNYIYFGYAGGTIGSVSQATTGSVAFNTTSDERLKQDIVDMPDMGAIIDALRPRLFAFKVEPDRTLSGLIAQEAVAVLPEVVTHNEVDDTWGIDYGKLTPVLLREIQSLRARVAALGG